jgi:coenzyme PQQ precursor peptide PqqA
MEWITPDFEELDTSAEVTAYAGRWEPAEWGSVHPEMRRKRRGARAS